MYTRPFMLSIYRLIVIRSVHSRSSFEASFYSQEVRLVLLLLPSFPWTTKIFAHWISDLVLNTCHPIVHSENRIRWRSSNVQDYAFLIVPWSILMFVESQMRGADWDDMKTASDEWGRWDLPAPKWYHDVLISTLLFLWLSDCCQLSHTSLDQSIGLLIITLEGSKHWTLERVKSFSLTFAFRSHARWSVVSRTSRELKRSAKNWTVRQV